MANQEQKNNSSKTPLILIGLVLLAVMAGGWWLYSSSQTKPTTAGGQPPATGQTANNQPPATDQTANDKYNSAPPGAQPPHMLGSPTATVTVEEFADFQCPTCASVHGLMKQIYTLYGSRIKLIYRNFPLPQHANADNAAAAAEAAGAQGKFWDMQNLLFVNQKEWSTDPNASVLFEKYAVSIGLDMGKFKSDVGSIPIRSRINNDIGRAQALGVSSTPTIFVNGKPVPFQQISLQGLSGIIDYELKNANNNNQPNSQNQTQKPDTPATDAKKTEETKEATNKAKTETEK